MKKLVLPLVLAMAALATLPSRAASATAQFDVTINVTASCQISSGPAAIVLTYDDSTRAATTNSPTAAFGVKCTNGLPYALSIDAPTTLAGLTYTLAILDNTSSVISTVQPDNSIKTAALLGAGTTNPTSYSVKASIAAGQSANCTAGGTLSQLPGGCKDTKTHTLTLTY